MPHRVHKLLHNHATAWIILAASLLVTALAWYISNESVKKRAEDRFFFRTEDLIHAIGERMLNYEQVLWGGIGLFKSSEEVTRLEWFNYVENLRLNDFYPGIQGIGYSKMIPPEELEAHEQQIRGEGFPNYVVRPRGIRPLYSAIVYLEPFDVRNRRAFGFDMYSEPTRRKAMERACDTGEAAISGMVTLVQEMDKDIQKGFLMYLPHYRNGAPTQTVAQRREALEGFVYSPFRIGDLMRGVLGRKISEIGFTIYDGDEVTREQIMYTSENMPDGQEKPEYRRVYQMKLNGGHPWTVVIESTPSFVGADDAEQPMIVAIGGLIIDLLLFIVITSISRSEGRAHRIAESMTNNLQEVSRRFELASRSAKLGIWEYDLNTGELNWDQKMKELYEITDKNFKCEYADWEKSLHPDDKERTVSTLSAAIRGEGDFDTFFRILTPSGQTRIIKANAYVERNDQGSAIRIIGFNSDVTALRKTEESLNIRNRAIEAAPYGVIITSVKDDNAIIYVNPAFSAITGFTAEEALGKNCRFLSSGKRDQAALDILRRSIERQESCTVVLRNQRKDGSPFWNRLSISPVKDTEGSTTHFVGIQEDITTEKHQENRLRELITEAKQMARIAEAANRAKSQFLANMSHEIRTPMNAILGFTDVLAREISDQDHIRHVQAISSSGRLLLQLINDILDLSKIEAGHLLIDPQPVCMPDLLFELKTLFAIKTEEKGIQFDIISELSRTKSYTVDEVRVRQVLFNLIGNAIKFTPSGEVAVHAVEAPGSKPNTSTLVFEVTDSGIGIPQEYHEAIFEPFRQQEGQSNRKYGGTGLGLSICKRLAELMDGSLELQSTPGVGSTFTFKLNDVPVRDSAISPSDQSATNHSLSFKPAHVLAVDDVPENLNLIEAYMRQLKLKLSKATNGKEALELAEKLMPDIIIMDLRMPEMDGREAMEHLRASERTRDIPVLILTASAHRSEEEELKKLCNGFLTKPIAFDDLIEKLSEHLPIGENANASSQQSRAARASASKSNPIDEATREILCKHRETLMGSLWQQWERARTSGMLEEIHTLAESLTSLGENTALSDYGRNLKEAARSLDFDAMKRLLGEYPNWIDTADKTDSKA